MNAIARLETDDSRAVSDVTADPAPAFRTLMRGIASTVTLITACDGKGKWHGMAATAFSSVSMEPATCLVCVNHTASIYETLHETGRFCVNVMHQRNRLAMRAYTKPEFRAERFQEAGWQSGIDGVPFNIDAQANVFCRLLSAQRVGSHDVVVAEVMEASLNGRDIDPLVYCDGIYRPSVMTS